MSAAAPHQPGVRIYGPKSRAGTSTEGGRPAAPSDDPVPTQEQSYASRYLDKFHHDVLYDAFEHIWLAKAAAWRATAADLRPSHPDQALACENHAMFIEMYWAEWFDEDYWAVMAEMDGIDPIDAALARLEVRLEMVA